MFISHDVCTALQPCLHTIKCGMGLSGQTIGRCHVAPWIKQRSVARLKHPTCRLRDWHCIWDALPTRLPNWIKKNSTNNRCLGDEKEQWIIQKVYIGTVVHDEQDLFESNAKREIIQTITRLGNDGNRREGRAENEVTLKWERNMLVCHHVQ